jgi:hypothetical protein
MAFVDLTKQLAEHAIGSLTSDRPAVPAPPENIGAIVLGQLQAMQKALKEDEELIVRCHAGGESIRVLEVFIPSWPLVVLTGVDANKHMTRVISPIESIQLVCKVMKAPAGTTPARIRFVAPKPKPE